MGKKEEFRVAWVGTKGTSEAGQIGLSVEDPNSSFWDSLLPSRQQPSVQPRLAMAAAHS
jgi:hypothetical protein